MGSALPQLAVGAALTIDVRVMLLTVVVILMTGLLVAIAPVASLGRQAGPGARAGLTHTAPLGWSGRALVAGQVAVTLVLLTATTATLSVVVRSSRVDLGFENDHALLFEVTLPDSRYRSPAAVVEVGQRLEQALSAIPGVIALGLSTQAPASTALGMGTLLAREDQTLDLSDATGFGAALLAVTPSYFQTMGIPVAAGRPFAAGENRPDSRSLVLGESTARTLWGSAESAVGRRAQIALPGTRGPALYDVIGVVRDVRLRGLVSTEFQVYVPFAVAPSPNGLVVAASTLGDPAPLWSVLSRRIAAIDPDLPIYNRLLVRDVRARFLARERLTLALTGVIGAIAMALCTAGLYGILAQSVALRAREIGVRIALGARPARLQGAVIRNGLAVVAVGLAVGLLGAGATTHVLRRFVPEVDAPSMPMIAGSVFVLLGAALLGSWIPARRAASVDPLVALRTE
ncbi:MAG TPA: FtsX-like permease family protein, partial [Vicinamibacterales bacterium]